MNAGMKLIRMNLVMKLIVCIWLGIRKHLFDSLHSYGCGQAHLDFPKVILNIESATCQGLIKKIREAFDIGQ